jgi:hypothetical protein
MKTDGFNNEFHHLIADRTWQQFGAASRCRHSHLSGVIATAAKSNSFFKGIMLQLRIETYFGASENSVQSQILDCRLLYVSAALIWKWLKHSPTLLEFP